MLPIIDKQPSPSIVPFFDPICVYCKSMLSIRWSKDLDSWIIEHSWMSEYLLEQDYPVQFCPNNAKRWRCSFPDYVLTELP